MHSAVIWGICRRAVDARHGDWVMRVRFWGEITRECDLS
jgi:hypothetical protein